MLIHSASQLLTLSGGPQRGTDLGRLEIIPQGAVLIRNGIIEAIGTTRALIDAYPGESQIDAGGKVVMPGFVDPHTHMVWGGERSAEFEMRLQGKTYMEIMEAGGGILSTVRSTRDANVEDLVEQTRPRMLSMFQQGTTTAEVKTGYGLETEPELRQLEAILQLDSEGPMELVPTHLGAHAVPPDYPGGVQAFTEYVCDEMLPRTKEWWHARADGSTNQKSLPFVDVFCEEGVFDLTQSRKILETASELGFGLKIHADEFVNLGGASLAAALGAVSADHLVKTSQEDIEALAKTNTVAVALPCTPFGLAESEYTPAKKILEAGGLLAVATDINPGPAWCESMQFVLTLACRYMRLTPAQAIAAATINAAAAIGRADNLGSLETGKQADMLILKVDDYRHLGYRFGQNLVDTVIKKGVSYHVCSFQ
ncbi:MAG: imidazolonepropionase [Anaerolineaceae bacterium]|nr:imidazolonepropionase [Anaerolineaceae bacterium]